MPDNNVTIRLRADDRGVTATFKRFASTAKGLAEGMSQARREFRAINPVAQAMTRGMSRAGVAARELAARQAAARRAGAALASSMAASGRATQRLHTAAARLALGMRQAGMAARQQAAAQAEVATTAASGADQVGRLRARTAGYVAGTAALLYTTRRVAGALAAQADAYTELNNRLRLVTDSESQLLAVRRRLLDISQDTRTATAANAQLYSRIALSAEQTGHSQAQLLRVTELLNKQVLIGGNNASEAAAGLVQFAQGLASGRLQGDELRSVMENLLGVQQGLLEGFRILRERGQIDFDVTRANIRDLAAEGVLSARLLLDAILASADDTEQKFQDVEITLSGATQRLGNAFLELFGRIDEVTGASDSLAESLSGVAADITDKLTTSAYELRQQIIDLEQRIERVPEFIRVIPIVDQSYQRQLAALRERLAALQAGTPAGNRVAGHAPVRRDAPVARAGLTAPSAFEVLAGVADPHEPSRRAAQAALARTRAAEREAARREREEAARREAAARRAEAGQGQLDFLLTESERINREYDRRVDRVREHHAELQNVGRTQARALRQIEMDRQQALAELERRGAEDRSAEAARSFREAGLAAIERRNQAARVSEQQTEQGLIAAQRRELTLIYAHNEAVLAAGRDVNQLVFDTTQRHAEELEAFRQEQRDKELAAERAQEAEKARIRAEARAQELVAAQGFRDQEAADEAAHNAQLAAAQYEYNQEQARLQALISQALAQQGLAAVQTQLEIIKQGASALSNLNKTFFRVYKAAAIAQTLIATYQSAQAAYAKAVSTYPPPLGQALGVTFAAAAVAVGLGRVAQIRAQQPTGFQRGGIVDRPTFFTARNVPRGVAGEAGPEAILPLRRGPGGQLGVNNFGAGARPPQVTLQTTLHVNASGPIDDVTIERLARTLEQRQEKMIMRVLVNQQRPGGVFNRTEQVA